MDPVTTALTETAEAPSDIPAVAIPTDFGPLWGGVTLILSVLLTQLARKLAAKWPSWKALSDILVPSIAVLLAVFLRAFIATVGGDPITASILLEGAVAGTTAVFGHTQWRSFQKRLPELLAVLFVKKSTEG